MKSTNHIFTILCLALILVSCTAAPAVQEPGTAPAPTQQPIATSTNLPAPQSTETKVEEEQPVATQMASTPTAWEMTIAAFAQGESIPEIYSCKGKDISPALAWSVPPSGTQSLILIMDDPDAPNKDWVHWVVYNIPADASGLVEGASIGGQAATGLLPPGTQQGKNSWGRMDYGGPCPPSGQHRYFFKLYALDMVLTLDKPAKKDVLAAMEGHILQQLEWMGVFKH